MHYNLYTFLYRRLRMLVLHVTLGFIWNRSKLALSTDCSVALWVMLEHTLKVFHDIALQILSLPFCSFARCLCSTLSLDLSTDILMSRIWAFVRCENPPHRQLDDPTKWMVRPPTIFREWLERFSCTSQVGCKQDAICCISCAHLHVTSSAQHIPVDAILNVKVMRGIRWHKRKELGCCTLTLKLLCHTKTRN